ncbi:MAG: AmmeMemoRadiSam system protein A [Elusimicrobia bacterium]|nr:AmmeMemoRadiSam system protein A [Elusimicrobiota bacterium]
MRYAQRAGYPKARLVRYATSADVTGDKSSVVGYASIVFSRDPDRAPSALSEAQKEELLRTARRTVETFVRTGEAPPAVSDDPRLQVREGAFVTLHKKGQLRGCIGLIQGDRPLVETVRDMAIAAASSDPRFDPVRPDELGDIDLEISVLSVPRVVRGAEEIELGRHGVIVSRGPFHRGVFLPQVATETGWGKEEFLSQLCSQKAGLSPQAWREAGTILEVFTADVFSEKK